MTRAEYENYKKAVKGFFDKEGIHNLSQVDMEREPHFSWSPCNCCRRPTGGNRYECSGWNPSLRRVQSGYSVCEDCVYYCEYHKLDDTQMLEIERSSE